MRFLLTSLLSVFSFWGYAQKHSIAVSSGASYITSLNGENPISLGSPFEARLGLSLSVKYNYILKNNFLVTLRVNSTQLSLFDANSSIANGQTGNFEDGPVDLTLHHLTNSFGVGYNFNLTRLYTLGLDAGGTVFYLHRETAESDQVENSYSRVDLDFDTENLFYGVYLENNHYFNVYRSRDTDIHLLAGFRTTAVFDYLRDDNSPRLLPELFLGVAVAFSRSGQKRF